MKSIHIRCGNDIKDHIGKIDIGSTFIEFSDPLCHGPIAKSSHNNILERVNFISSAYKIPIEEVNSKLKLEYESLCTIETHDQVTLWFEHDHYDQLIFLYLLDYFSNQEKLPEINLICIDRYEGIERFVGLGQLNFDQLNELWKTKRVLLNKAVIQAGASIWQMLVNRDLNFSLIDQTTINEFFPFTENAINRYYQDDPTQVKYPLTYLYTLEILNDSLSSTAIDLFKTLNKTKEKLPFLGDQMYWYLLREMHKENLIEIDLDNSNFSNSLIKSTSKGIKALSNDE